MIIPKNLIEYKPDLFSGNSGYGTKAFRKDLLLKGDKNEGDDVFMLTKQRIIMENKIFGKLDFTQDLKRNLD